MAEQISRAGVSVFAADIKGDLSGIALPGTPSEKLSARTQAIGQDWNRKAAPPSSTPWAARAPACRSGPPSPASARSC